MSLDRDWVRASLDLMVLGVLADEPTYGYLVQRRIRTLTQEQVKVPGGTLYPLLHRLEHAGLIAGENREDNGQLRRWYRLTEAGRLRLHRQTDQWRRLGGFLSTLLGGPSAEPAPPGGLLPEVEP